MCFDVTTSLIAFSISILCSYSLLQGSKNDTFFGIGVFLIGLIQLNEFFLWQNQTCSLMNHLLSLSIIVILYLQCVIMCMVYYTLYPVRAVHPMIVQVYIALYTCFTAYLLYVLNQAKLCSRPKGSCRLAWAPYTYLGKQHPFLLLIHILFYFIPFFIFVIETITYHLNDVLRYKVRYACLPVTFMLGVLFAFTKESFTFPLSYVDVFGSLWCFLSVVLGIVGVLHI
jgi:hypothetical protein